MIVIGLGANLDGPYGPPPVSLRACVAAFAEHGIELLRASHLWRTAPVPVSDQPWYYNAVCVVKTSKGPEDVLQTLKQIELAFGRRDGAVINAPRAIDLDLLAYDAQCIDTPELTVPHPRLHQRAFVLYPLREVAPGWVHPRLGLDLKAMLAAIPSEQHVEKLENEGVLL